MEPSEKIIRRLKESADIKKRILEDKSIVDMISKVAEEIVKAFQRGNKVLLCGNGGSAADAQHIAAELSGRFYKDRKPLFAEALHVNTSYLTAVANDYSYEEVFSRLVLAKGRNGDILIGISTSGNSKNIIKAIQTAKDLGMITIGLLGGNGGQLKELCDLNIVVPSNDVARIQEAHITIGHIICEIVEEELFG
uniref:Phosphoheptose isomerase n=1 Tax=Fervidobacterium pennivorans TaxID=93466 RepID=A0A7V4KCL1_FERPE